ncbi:Mkk2p [Rhizophagus irregularis DAOM 197198w]|uniref:Mkk2p n=1 Tax=Rhizophagus irregularis (strain DAOM 197198w) TaxID=1432141 RepID=A0A015IJI4_RHIIW|nr:Mkk2p [Rhizophagus irregularis DAOM 197198w]
MSMSDSINYKLKIDFLISNNNTPSITLKPKLKKCIECNLRRKHFDGNNQICEICYRAKTIIQSGNKVIDDFIRYTLTNSSNIPIKMEFVSYDKFSDITFIAEGGFSKIYKATWLDGPISRWNNEKQKYCRSGKMTVALKELNNSKNIVSKELHELKLFYNFALNQKSHNNGDVGLGYINKYFGITQNPVTSNFMIITRYYESGDITNYITKDFTKVSWHDKLGKLYYIITGLKNIHEANIIHKDFHSGNIFIYYHEAITGDLGINKSAIETLNGDNDNEIYGIIPYVAPEILQGQKYTKASDIYSFGMVMWELMTGRKPFWDKCHDSDLIIEICDGLRPPIVTNAPEGYIELMQKCWHPDPNKRPKANDILNIFWIFGKMRQNEYKNPTEIVNSSHVGPIITNNPGTIYKSRSLSMMIKSAESTRTLRGQNIISKFSK